MPDVCITEFTSPACPWAFSAEPFRLRLNWIYGDSINWESRMVVLSETQEEAESSSLTPAKMADAFRKISHLARAEIPLATKEVAVLCDIPMEDARQNLGLVATESHVGFDGFWSLDE